MHEKCMIRPRTDDANLNTILRIPPSKPIETVKPVADVETIKGALAHRSVRVWIEWNICRTPPDVLFRAGILDDAFILGRTACLLPRIRDQSSILGNSSLLVVTYRVFV